MSLEDTIIEAIAEAKAKAIPISTVTLMTMYKHMTVRGCMSSLDVSQREFYEMLDEAGITRRGRGHKKSRKYNIVDAS